MLKTTGATVRVLAAALLISGSLVPAQAQFRLISEGQEMEAGRQADRELLQKYRLSRDSNYSNMVQHMGRRLAAVSERPNIDWTFRVLDSRELNAFSVPGYVYMTTATLDALRGDQDAVAGVLAHEIAHTTGKHAVKQMEKGAIGNLLIGLIGGKNKTIGGLAGVAANLVMMGYSRDDENDADKRAVRYTLKAGYDPNGLVRFFQYLQAQGDRGGGGLATYFRTHPQTSDRISRVQKLITQEGGTVRNTDRRYRTDRYDEREYDRSRTDRTREYDRYRDDPRPRRDDRYRRDRYRDDPYDGDR
jgi:beta-barrel assembly-enhancing protease